MDWKRIFSILGNVEKTLGQILYYLRLVAEKTVGLDVDLPETLLTDQDVMRKLGISRRTLHRRRTEKLLPSVTIKRRHYYKESDVMAMLGLPNLTDGQKKPGRKRVN